jgi:hypothetical protein
MSSHELSSDALEGDSPESFGEDVCQLIGRRNVLKGYSACGYCVTDEVVTNIDMLGAIVMDIVLADSHC